jgi:lycopene beta-cyclase
VLWQYSKGWEIETPDKRFHPECATFMDFTTPQHNEMRFFYVLPLSETRALVEYVTQSPVPSDEAFKVYLSEVLGIADYEIRGREGGVNPLSDWTFPRRVGKHSMTIGTCGGRIKPSSGYAFMRIQQDSAAIVNSLERFGDPFRVPADSQYYRLCDALMLELMARQGGQIKSIFTELFKNNPIERVLRFLDEAASPAENAGLIASLPPKLFLQALFRLKVLSLLEGGRKQ